MPNEREPAKPLKHGAGFPPANSAGEKVGASATDNWYAVLDRLKRQKKVPADFTAAKLIEFNFGLKTGESFYPEKVNYYLRTLIGCQNTTSDRNNYIFLGASPGLVYYPVAAPPPPAVPVVTGTHVVIIGGISVNDPKHDKYPYNFINPALRLAKELKARGKTVLVLMHAYSYEQRVLKHEDEDRRVQYDDVPDDKRKHHYWNVTKKTTDANQIPLKAFLRPSDLTAELNALPAIESIHYFGHSDAHAMFVQYHVDSKGPDRKWGPIMAGNVQKAKFVPGASFVSLGCFQAEPGGLAAKLRDMWGIRTVGAHVRTDYSSTVDDLKIFPYTKEGYFEYPAPVPGSSGPPARQGPMKPSVPK